MSDNAIKYDINKLFEGYKTIVFEATKTREGYENKYNRYKKLFTMLESYLDEKNPDSYVSKTEKLISAKNKEITRLEEELEATLKRDPLTDQLTTLETNIADKQKSIAELEEIIKQAEEDLKSNRGNLKSKEDDLESRKDYYEANPGEKTSLETEIALLKTAIADLEKNIKDLKTQLEGYKTELKTFNDTKNDIINNKIPEIKKPYHEKMRAIEEEVKQLKYRLERRKTLKTKYEAELEKLLKLIVDSKKVEETIDSINGFKKYLVKKGINISYAEILYNAYKDQKNTTKIIIEDTKLSNYKLRKQHPIRDKFLKSYLHRGILAAIPIATILSIFVSSPMAAGSNFLGMTMSANPLTLIVRTSLISICSGFGIAIAGDKIKDAIIRKSIKNKYGTTKDLERLKLDDLIADIRKAKVEILEQRLTENNQSWLKKLFTSIPRHWSNAKNRDRIHHLGNIAEDLHLILADPSIEDSEIKKTALEMLKKINNFVAEDIVSTKYYAMISNDSNIFLEYIDIYAKIYEVSRQAIKVNTYEDKKRLLAARVKENTIVRDNAENLINSNAHVLDKVIEYYQEVYEGPAPVVPPARPDPKPVSVVSFFKKGNKLTIILSNKKQAVIEIDKDWTITNVTLEGSETIIHYTLPDGTSKTTNMSLTYITRKMADILAAQENYIKFLENADIRVELAKDFSERAIDKLIEQLKEACTNQSQLKTSKILDKVRQLYLDTHPRPDDTILP